MYLAIDIGGTKTLVAVFDASGKLLERNRFPTPGNYADFLLKLAETVAELSTDNWRAGCVGFPGHVDRDRGVGLAAGNLSWENVPIIEDLQAITKVPMLLENDAKLAGLAEAMLLINKFKRTLYITVSTGIGTALITNGVIDTDMGDGGGKSMLIEHGGKLVPWESFASGKAIVAQFGRKASDIPVSETQTWKMIARNLSVGILELTAVLQPEVIVIGGGVGAHFKNFEQPLLQTLKTYETPLMPLPPIKQAKHPEEAVIYGCYELAKGTHERTN